MQAERPRGSGFIVVPTSLPLTTAKPEKSREKPFKASRELKIFNFFSYIINEVRVESPLIFKKSFSFLLSFSVAVCCVTGLCRFFVIGFAIYNEEGLIAYSYTENDYLYALSEAKTYAESNNISDFGTQFTVVPSFTLRNKTDKNQELTDKLLASSDYFDTACTLYSDNVAVFCARNEETAKKVVENYISAFSMNGEAAVESVLTYKSEIIPTSSISDEEECSMLLLQSEAVPVVSIVNSSLEKEIPFSTETREDSDLYIGETITVTAGKSGSSEVESETVYLNGTPQSIRIVSENVVAEPVTQVVKIGTKPKDVLTTGLLYPLTGMLSSPFGQRWGKMHEGIDIAVPVGTSVKAAECGTVIFAGNGGTYGNLVKIDHGNGVVTAYAHLDTISVFNGQTVDSNTEIAKSGNTGRSTGPHLHFEIVKNGTALDPITYLKKR